MNARPFCLSVRAWLVLIGVVTAGWSVVARAADSVERDFDIPAGEALVTLKQFVAQSGAQLIYSVEEVEGVRTQPARGRFGALAALARMFDGTPLSAARDGRTGGLSVRRTGVPAGVGSGRAGTLSGSVSNVRTGKFLEGAQVRIVGLDRQTLTNERGLFTFANLPAGTYDVEVSYIGLSPMVRQIVVRADGPVSLTYEMDAAIYQMSTFVVTGEREGNAASLTAQRNALNVKNVVAMDAYGNLPNDSVGELAMRLPGVAGQHRRPGERPERDDTRHPLRR
jgi:hypothetical protein